MCLTRLCSRASPSNIIMQSRLASGFNMVPAQSQTLNKDFWDKNSNLKRPISPHLGIYKIQLTTSLSIFHRITGAGVGALLYGGGIGFLCASSTTFPEVLQLIQESIPHFIILSGKVGVAGGFLYHTLNGIRHLVWDMGYGFQLKHLQLSGIIVIVLTGLGSALVLLRG